MTQTPPPRCPVCQHDCRAEDELFAGACGHAMHEECAREYVDHFRLDFPGERPRCPLCKAAVDVDDFQPSLTQEEEQAEQQRRALMRAREQLAEDERLAREIFFDDFGVHVGRRRQSLRASELQVFFWIGQPEHRVAEPRAEEETEQ